MKFYIKDITTITGWYYVRSNWGDLTINYLQVIDFNDWWEVRDKLIPALSIDDINSKQLLKDWDILVTSKWSRTISILYKESYWPSIASSTFFILRIKNQNIIPEYLSLYLNEALKTPYFKNHFSGGTVPSIPKSVIENYEIAIPTLDNQQTFIELYHAHKIQLNIYDELKTKKSQLINSLILS